MQNPADVRAQAKIRIGWAGWAASDDFQDLWIDSGNPRLRDHQAEPRPFPFPTRPIVLEGVRAERTLLWTEPAQRLQSPRLNAANLSHRDLKYPSRVHVRPGLAIGKAKAQFQNASIQVVQAEQQFPHRQRLDENLIQLITGM